MNEDLSYQVELIERVKKELGMSQSDIARKFEIARSYVSDWMNKKSKMKPPYRIALELMLKNKEQQEVMDWIQKIPSIMRIAEQK
jgi:transcriptional regulator with XRE-family HTH domain